MPTPAPTEDPDYASGEGTPGLLAAGIAIVVFLQVALAAYLVARSMKRSKKKSEARGEGKTTSVLEGFSTAHIIDLFGTANLLDGSGNGGAAATARAMRRIQARAFSKQSLEAMFYALDVDHDGYISREDLRSWASTNGTVLTDEEIDNFVTIGEKNSRAMLMADIASGAQARRMDVSTPRARLETASFRSHSQDGMYGIDRDQVKPQPRGSTTPPLQKTMSRSQSLVRITSWVRPKKQASRAHLEMAPIRKEDLVPTDERPEDRVKGVSKAAMIAIVRRFPTLAFDWNDVLQLETYANPVTISRSDNSDLFRSIDTNHDGYVHAEDVNVWRRMLPIGRSPIRLVEAVMSAGSDAKPDARRSMRNLSVNSSRRSTDSLSAAMDPANYPTQVTSRDLYLLLTQDIVLSHELQLQRKLLQYIIHYPDEAHEEGVDVEKDCLIFRLLCELQLTQIRYAYHEFEHREATTAGEIFTAMDEDNDGWITDTEIQRWFRTHTFFTVTLEELALLKDPKLRARSGALGRRQSKTRYFDAKHGTRQVTTQLDHNDLRFLLAAQVHHGIMQLLHQAVKTVELGSPTASPYRRASLNAHTVNGVPIDTPEAFTHQEAVHFFAALDTDQDGLISLDDLMLFVRASPCSTNLVTEVELRGLFHPKTPAFYIEPPSSKKKRPRRRISISRRGSKSEGDIAHRLSDKDHVRRDSFQTISSFATDDGRHDFNSIVEDAMRKKAQKDANIQFLDAMNENLAYNNGQRALREGGLIVALARRPFLGAKLHRLFTLYETMINPALLEDKSVKASMREYESMLKEAEAIDPFAHDTLALRRRLRELRAGSRDHRRTVLNIEAALQIFLYDEDEKRFFLPQRANVEALVEGEMPVEGGPDDRSQRLSAEVLATHLSESSTAYQGSSIDTSHWDTDARRGATTKYGNHNVHESLAGDSDDQMMGNDAQEQLHHQPKGPSVDRSRSPFQVLNPETYPGDN